MSKNGLYELTPRKRVFFFTYVDKSEIREINWLHNFFLKKINLNKYKFREILC